jgi:hypothetical protein
VLPRTAELQAAEDALSLALVAMVGGTRPAVSTAMVRDHLNAEFGIPVETVSVHRHSPEDLIVRFQRRDDLERVLHAPVAPAGAPLREEMVSLLDSFGGVIHVQDPCRNQGCPGSRTGRGGGSGASGFLLRRGPSSWGGRRRC